MGQVPLFMCCPWPCAVHPHEQYLCPPQFAAALAAGTYAPSAMDGPGPEVWIGFAAGIIPFAIGSAEFGKRIVSAGRSSRCKKGA